MENKQNLIRAGHGWRGGWNIDLNEVRLCITVL